jgi:hypothetical protein
VGLGVEVGVGVGVGAGVDVGVGDGVGVVVGVGVGVGVAAFTVMDRAVELAATPALSVTSNIKFHAPHVVAVEVAKL